MTQVCAPADAAITISIAFVHGILSGVRARNEAIDDFLADAGITAALLEQPSARVTAEQFVALFRSLTERRNDDLLGFVSRPLRRGSIAAELAGTLQPRFHVPGRSGCGEGVHFLSEESGKSERSA